MIKMPIFEWITPDPLQQYIHLNKPPTLRDFWKLKPEDLPKQGVYILVAKPGFSFKYPIGSSPIFYIGQSTNLKRRLIDHHLKWSKEARDDRQFNLYWPRYEYAAVYGSRYGVIETWQGMTPKALEDIVLSRFAYEYRAFPVANSQGPWKRINAL